MPPLYDESDDFNSGWEVDPPSTAAVRVSRSFPGGSPFSVKKTNDRILSSNLGQNGVKHVRSPSGEKHSIVRNPHQLPKSTSTTRYPATSHIPSPPRVGGRSHAYPTSGNYYTSASETEDITEYMSRSRDIDSIRRMKMYANNGTTARICGYREPKLHEKRENRLKKREGLLEALDILASAGVRIVNGKYGRLGVHRESIRALQAAEGWDNRIAVAKSTATNEIKKSPFDESSSISQKKRLAYQRAQRSKMRLPPRPEKGVSLFDPEEVSKAIVELNTEDHIDSLDTQKSQCSNTISSGSCHSPTPSKDDIINYSRDIASLPLLKSVYNSPPSTLHITNHTSLNHQLRSSSALSRPPNTNVRKLKAMSLPLKVNNDCDISVAYSRRRSGLPIYRPFARRGPSAKIKRSFVTLPKLPVHQAASDEGKRRGNSGGKADGSPKAAGAYYMHMCPSLPFQRGLFGAKGQRQTSLQTQGDVYNDRLEEDKSVTEEEEIALQKEIDDMEDSIRALKEKFEDIHRKRTERADIAVRVQSEINENLAEIETSHSQLITKEREMYWKKKKQKTEDDLMRQLELKEKQIRDSEKMLKAITNRLEKQRDLKLPDSPQAHNLTYPPGTDIKQKLRIATERRKETQNASELRKRQHDDLIRNIDKLRKQQEHTIRIQEQRKLQEATSRAAAKRALEVEELAKANEEINRLKESCKIYTQQQNEIQDRIKKMKIEADKMVICQEKRIAGDREQTEKDVNELRSGIERVNTEYDAVYKQEQDMMYHLYQLQNKHIITKTAHDTKKNELKKIYDMIFSLNSENKGQHCQGVTSVAKERYTHEIIYLQKQLKEIQDDTRDTNNHLSVLTSELLDITMKNEEAALDKKYFISVRGEGDDFRKKIEYLDADIAKVQKKREEVIKEHQLAKRKLEQESKAKDAEIERSTQKLNEIVNIYEKKSEHNTTLLQQLDVAERLVRMYNLKL